MTWFDIIATITKLTELDELKVNSCASALKCEFEPITSNRYRSTTLREPFDHADLISGNDNMSLLLTFRVDSAREEYVLRMLGLGKPIDIDNFSPPIAEVKTPQTNLDWDRKYSLCYEIGDCRVWFGIEVAGSQKKLVSIMIKR